MIFGCKINYWDEFDEKEVTEYRIVVAKTYAEVVAQLTDYFGEDNILKFTVEYFNDDTTIQCTEEIFSDLCEFFKRRNHYE